MTLSLLAFLLVLLATVAICGVPSFFIKKDKLLLSLSIKSGASAALLVLAILAANLSSNIGNISLFIILAVALQSISLIIAFLPTRNNMLAPLYLSIDIISTLLLCTAAFLMVSPSPFGLPIGFAVGAIAVLIFHLARKTKDVKKHLFSAFFFAFAMALLGQAIMAIITSQTISAIILLVASAFFAASALLRTFFEINSKTREITYNTLYYISMILFACVIYLV